MITGAILRDTSASVDIRMLLKVDFICAELCLVEKLARDERLEGKELIPMISAFLGSKTAASKEMEIEYSHSIEARHVLYFFDSLHIKHGRGDLFAAELRNLAKWSSRLEPIVYFPFMQFTDEERVLVSRHLVEQSIAVMVSVEEVEAHGANLSNVLRQAASRLKGNHLYVAFPDRTEHESYQSLFHELRPTGGAYYL